MNLQGNRPTSIFSDDLMRYGVLKGAKEGYPANEVPAILDRMEQKLRARKRDYSLGLSLKERDMFWRYSSFAGVHTSRTKFHRSQVLHWIEESRAGLVNACTAKLTGESDFWDGTQWTDEQVEQMLAAPPMVTALKKYINR